MRASVPSSLRSTIASRNCSGHLAAVVINCRGFIPRRSGPMSFKPPGQCPSCGEWVPRKALACDCCGACEKTGWKAESPVYDGLDLPDEDFDYDQFIENEFGSKSETKTTAREKLWRWVAAILLVVMILGYLLSAR